MDGAHVFVPAGKLDIPPKEGSPPSHGPSPAEHLASCGVAVHEYDEAYAAVEQASERCAASALKLWMDPNVANWDLLKAAQRGASKGAAAGDKEAAKWDGVGAPPCVMLESGPVPLMKAIKNDTELEGFANCHVRDGAALCRTFSRIFELVGKARGAPADGAKGGGDAGDGAPRVTEFHVAQEALRQRRADPSFFFPSFATIAGSGPKGAVIHYDPEEETALDVKLGRQLLVDSGGQYADGTTDVTRTMVVPRDPKAGAEADLGLFQRRCNTRVFQGFVAIANAVFPEGTRGEQIDVLARMFLWRDGLEFNHGTGHGVGAFLNVHEGPHGISPRGRPGGYTGGLKAGMTVTDEPGYYQVGTSVPGDEEAQAEDTAAAEGGGGGQVAMSGAGGEGKEGSTRKLCGEGFGYRVENVLSVVEAGRGLVPHRFGGRKVLRFRHLTWVPIQAGLFDLELLSSAERRFLDTYNAECRRLLQPLLSAEKDKSGTQAKGPLGVALGPSAEDDARGLAWMLDMTRPVGGWNPADDGERSPSLVDSPFYDGQGVLAPGGSSGAAAGSKRSRT